MQISFKYSPKKLFFYIYNYNLIYSFIYDLINYKYFMFETFTKNFTKYVCQNDSENLSNLFTKDGCYHDYIYGNFKGREKISSMLSDYFKTF